MAALERGLGRGLESLLRSTREADVPGKESVKLAITQIVPSEGQPRKIFNEATLNELASSIKSQGLLQPLIVRVKAGTSPVVYEIVAGERRWRAAKLAGLTEVPVIIGPYSDGETMTIALIENLQREDLNPVEEAQALQILRETYSLSQEELGAKLGKSRSAIANSLRLLQLPEAVLQGVLSNKISSGHARTLLGVTDAELLLVLYETLVEKDLSVRETEVAADYCKHHGQLPPDLTDQNGQPFPGKNPRAPKSEELKAWQTKLRASGHVGASLSGTNEKGKLTLTYSTHEELQNLMQALGVVS